MSEITHVNQRARGENTQGQNILHYNSAMQTMAIATAMGGTASTVQESIQNNYNYQIGNVVVENNNSFANNDFDVTQDIDGVFTQEQEIEQRQNSSQENSIATTTGENSEATAEQINRHNIENKQELNSTLNSNNNNSLENSMVVESNTRDVHQNPGEKSKVSKTINFANDMDVKPLEIVIALTKNGNTIEMRTNERGNTHIEGLKEMSQNSANIHDKGQMSNQDIPSDLKIKIDYNNEILEIHSDEGGRIFINCIEVELRE